MERVEFLKEEGRVQRPGVAGAVNAGYASRWKTVFSDLSAVEALANEVFGNKRSVAKAFMASFGGVGEKLVAAHKFDLCPGVSSFFVFVQAGEWVCASAYPAMQSGCASPFEVREVKERSNGLEAVVSGKAGDAALSFFATDYCLNKDRYLEKKVGKVDLSAFAYSLTVSTPGEPSQESGRAQAEVILPFGLLMKEAWPDDYYVQGKVLEVQPANSRGIDALVLKVSLSLIGFLKIFVRKDGLDRLPQAGDFVNANIWLQGREFAGDSKT